VAEEKKARPANPKQIHGDRKRRLDLVPPALAIGASVAYAEGVLKQYGPFNWRESHVEAMTYVAGILRHVYAFMDGEDVDPESINGKLHLEGIAACVGILLDTYYSGVMIDNRPPKGSAPEKLRDPGKQADIERDRALESGDPPMPTWQTLKQMTLVPVPSGYRAAYKPHSAIVGCCGDNADMKSCECPKDDLAGLAAREATSVPEPVPWAEFPTEAAVRDARVAAGAFDVLVQDPPEESFVRGPDSFDEQIARAAALDEKRRAETQANIDRMRADQKQQTQERIEHEARQMSRYNKR
jgi:hypothetical protein